MMRYILALSVGLFLFVACSTENQRKETLYYFSIASFMNEEMNRLTELNPVVQKTISREGKTETKKVKDINWETELLAFKENDINKPAYKDAYAVDTLRRDKYMEITYTANEVQLPIRKVKLHITDKETVTRLEIHKNPGKKIFTANTHLLYVPEKGYSITNNQKLVTFKEDAFTINVTFIK